VDRSGKFALVRIPSVRSCRKFLARVREWLGKHSHWKRRDQQKHLQLMLRGFYQYFGLHHCERKLSGCAARSNINGFAVCVAEVSAISSTGATC